MDVNNVTEKLIGMQKRLFNFAYSLTMNRDDAQDLLQSTSLKVLNNQEKFVNNDNFSGWIFTIMRNIFVIYLLMIIIAVQINIQFLIMRKEQ